MGGAIWVELRPSPNHDTLPRHHVSFLLYLRSRVWGGAGDYQSALHITVCSVPRRVLRMFGKSIDKDMNTVHC